MDLGENRGETETDCVGRRREMRGGVVVSVRGKRGRLALCSRRPPFQGPTAAIGKYNSSFGRLRCVPSVCLISFVVSLHFQTGPICSKNVTTRGQLHAIKSPSHQHSQPPPSSVEQSPSPPFKPWLTTSNTILFTTNHPHQSVQSFQITLHLPPPTIPTMTTTNTTGRQNPIGPFILLTLRLTSTLVTSTRWSPLPFRTSRIILHPQVSDL